jgi:hypothetical protein
METEADIERRVEFKVDALDRLFLTTAMTQETYDAKMREIDEWSAQQRAGLVS